MDELNCDELPGRLRDICRGHDSHGNPVLTPEKCARYRQFFIDGQFRQTHIHPAKEPKGNQLYEKKQRLLSWIRWLKKDTDRGVGDTVERILAKVGGKQIKLAIKKLGGNCGCQNRIDYLNKKYPYTN